MNALDRQLDEQLGDAFDRKLNELLEAHRVMNMADDGVTNYKAVSPAAKQKLKGLLKYYAKKPHPFTACVNDNTKRFGPERAKKVCAVLKDIIRGTTKWRGKNNPRDHGISPAAMSETEMTMDADTLDLIDRLGELDLWELMGLSDLEGDSASQLADYSFPDRMKMAKKGHALPDGSFPIAHEKDVQNAVKAVGRAKDKSKAKKHIVNRAKALDAMKHVPAVWAEETANVKLAYPMGPDLPPPLTEADHAFLKKSNEHNHARLKHATKYLTGDPHPDVAGFARDAVTESTRHIERTNRMQKTGRPY